MSLIAASTTQNLHRAAEAEIKNLKQWRNTYNQDPLNDHWKLLDEGDVNQTDGRQLIPAPSLFKSLATTTTNNTSAHSTEEGQSIPTIGQCAAHLELLEAFFTLRHHIVNSAALDKTFGVKINNKIVYRKKFHKRMGAYVYKKTPLRDTTYPDRRREKWDFYLKIAAVRFEAWIRVANHAVEKSVREKGGAVSLPHLPPLGMSFYFQESCISERLIRSLLIRYYHGLARVFAESHRFSDLLPRQEAERDTKCRISMGKSCTFFLLHTC